MFRGAVRAGLVWETCLLPLSERDLGYQGQAEGKEHESKASKLAISRRRTVARRKRTISTIHAASGAGDCWAPARDDVDVNACLLPRRWPVDGRVDRISASSVRNESNLPSNVPSLRPM